MSGWLVAAITITPILVSEAVHLNQHLVQRLFTFVVTAQAKAPRWRPDGIDFIDDEMMQGAFFWRYSNMSRNTGCTHANEHFTKPEPEMVKNGTLVSLAIDLMPARSLPVPRRANQQQNHEEMRPPSLELCGPLEEIHDL